MNIFKKFFSLFEKLRGKEKNRLSEILFDENFRPGYKDFSYKNYQFDVFNRDEIETKYLKTLKYKGKKVIKYNEDYMVEMKIKDLFKDLAEEQRKEYVSQFNKIKIRKK